MGHHLSLSFSLFVCVLACVRACVYACLEVDVVGQEEEPGPGVLTRAEAEDLGHVLSAEGRVRHQHVVLRDGSALDHLDKTARAGPVRTVSETQDNTLTKKKYGTLVRIFV